MILGESSNNKKSSPSSTEMCGHVWEISLIQLQLWDPFCLEKTNDTIQTSSRVTARYGPRPQQSQSWSNHCRNVTMATTSLDDILTNVEVTI